MIDFNMNRIINNTILVALLKMKENNMTILVVPIKRTKYRIIISTTIMMSLRMMITMG